MKIIHVDLSGPFNPEMNYQESILARIHKKQGHDVTIVGTCLRWNNGVIENVPEIDTYLDGGIRFIRLKYDKRGGKYLSSKIRDVKRIEAILEDLAPNLVMLHCFQTKAILRINKFVKKHPEVSFVIDSHTEMANSARNIISRYVLHGMIYGRWAKKGYDIADRVFPINVGAKQFLNDIYNLKSDKMEILPLGGIILQSDDYDEKRNRIRKENGIADSDVVFFHAGKLTAEKKTSEVLRAFKKAKRENSWLVIAGAADGSIKDMIKKDCEEHDKIRYVGWLSGEDVMSYLCASDVYVQPGTLSTTLNNAICCGCAIMTYPHMDYKELLQDNALYIKGIEDIYVGICLLADDADKLKDYKEKSKILGINKLDYNLIAKRIIEVAEDEK